MPQKTFAVRQLDVIDKKLDDLARDLTTIQFLNFRLFDIQDISLYPMDWKKLSKLEREKWMENTSKRINDQVKKIEKEIKQLNQFIKTLNK